MITKYGLGTVESKAIMFCSLCKEQITFCDCCHEPAPRGSKTGTQGEKNSEYRGVVPEQLCKELLIFIEG